MFWKKDHSKKVMYLFTDMYSAITAKNKHGAPRWKKYDSSTKKLRRLIKKESTVRAMRFDIDGERLSILDILSKLDSMERTQFREMSELIYKATRASS